MVTAGRQASTGARRGSSSLAGPLTQDGTGTVIIGPDVSHRSALCFVHLSAWKGYSRPFTLRTLEGSYLTLKYSVDHMVDVS
jgi:hypothetical protein